MRHTRVLLLLILLAGVALRLWFLWASQWMVEGDEAAVGLQALHILRGERPIFFPGQFYLGNFESYLTAAVFAPRPSRFALKLVPFAFGVLFIYFSFRLGSELFEDERAGLFAALAAAIAPVYFVLWSVKARGGYIEALVLAQLLLLWFNRWLARPATGRSARVTPFMVGLLGGYVFWLNPISVFILAPLAVILVLAGVVLLVAVRDRRAPLQQVVVALGGALLGLMPFLLFRLAYGDAALQVISGPLPPRESWPDLIANAWLYFWRDGLPTLLGLRGPKDNPFQLDLRVIVTPLYLAALVWLAVLAARLPRRSSPLRFAGEETSLPRNASLLVLCLLLAFPVFAYGVLSGGNFATIIPDSGLLTRFLLPLYIPLTLALGLLFSALSRTLRLVALLVLLGVNLWSAFSADAVALARNEFANQPLPASSADVERFLLDNDLNFVLTNHWIGYVLTLDTREQIVTYDYTDSRFGTDRFPDYTRQVLAARNPALVVFNPHFESNPIDARLRQLGITYQKADLPSFLVYYNFQPPIGPQTLDGVLLWPYY